MHRLLRILKFCFILGAVVGVPGVLGEFRQTTAQDKPVPKLATPDKSEEEPEVAPPTKQVDVKPVSEDGDISVRLERILRATGWFTDATVSVDQGVAFLKGTVDTEAHQEWATKLAGQTQDVVAVVNQMQVRDRPLFELAPAWSELRKLGRETIRYMPLVFVGAIILYITWMVTSYSASVSRAVLKRRWENGLLRDVMARAIAIPVFLVGLYIALRVSGLTQVALTVLGGTGLVGLVLGFAFRDIAENFLASILISMQHPFATGDLIEVAGFKGFVQSVNTRATVLTTLEGNRVQIPNATIYKEPIVNKTTSPTVRCDFILGIGVHESISQAQGIALQVLQDHEAVLPDPEPLVLVDGVTPLSTNLQILFWINSKQHNSGKVKSAIIRLIQAGWATEGISIPDGSRQLVMLHPSQPDSLAGVRQGLGWDSRTAAGNGKSAGRTPFGTEQKLAKDVLAEESESHIAEGNLESEDQKIIELGDLGRKPEEEINLLEK